jgi:spore coat protein U-like protein
VRLLRSWIIASLLGFFAMEAGAQAPCSYDVVTTELDFGSITGDIISPIDITGTISITCAQLLSGIVNRRVCLSLPEGTGGVSIADRRMRSGDSAVDYQIYSNSGRTVVWGQGSAAVAVDFTNLTLGVPQTRTVTIYARVFGGQSSKLIGRYLSTLSGVARWQNYLLGFAPDCSAVNGNSSALSPIAASLEIAPQCTVLASPLDFGAVAGLTGHGATTNLSVTCSATAPYEIALDGGSVSGDIEQRRMKRGSDTIIYQLFLDAGRSQPWGDGTFGGVFSGTGSGLAQSVPIYGWIPPQAPRPAGDYADVITATLTY